MTRIVTAHGVLLAKNVLTWLKPVHKVEIAKNSKK
jgi:hypothetical protein